ncbi:MAG TPA: histidine kinase [Solirubrobacteraceae bacterium]
MSGPATQELSLPRWQRALLPGALLEAGAGRRSARDWVVDVVMFLLAIGIGVGVLAATWDDHSTLQATIDIAVGVACCLSLWVRRSHPTAVAVLTAVASIFSALAAGPAILALFNAAIRTSAPTILVLVGLSAVSTVSFPLVYPGSDDYVAQLVIGALCTGVVIGWGLFVRAQREVVYSLRERAEQLEAEQRLKVEQAREAERLRIAREMHDVLAHRVSLLSLHAGALEFRPDASAEEVAEAAGVIRASARAALEELRDILGVLREGENGGAPEPPQPTLADVPALIEEWRAAGVHVQGHIDPPPDVPAALGRTVYRVVQEGLTNARKHAAGAAVDVTIAADDHRLVVEVVNRRPVGVPAGAPGERLPGAGTGLVGLAERVALAGGELEHGPDAAGDFVLRASLPCAP